MNLCSNLLYSISRLCTLLLCIILGGCTGSNGQLTVVEQHPDLDYELTGIPLLFFGFGTSTPITPELSLTVAHVAKLNYDKVIAYHPQCDLAIVESRNTLNHQPKFVGLSKSKCGNIWNEPWRQCAERGGGLSP